MNLGQWQSESLPPWHGVSIPLQPILPTIRRVPCHVADIVMLRTSRGSPRIVVGGLLAVVCLETLTGVVYPMPIPCHFEHSYAVEVYPSWVLYRVKSMFLESPHVSRATVCSVKEGGNFTKSKSVIMALTSRPAQVSWIFWWLNVFVCRKVFPRPRMYILIKRVLFYTQCWMLWTTRLH